MANCTPSRGRPGRPRLPAAVLVFVSCSASAAELTVEIQGLDDDLRQAVSGQLALTRYQGHAPTPAEIRSAFAGSDEQIRKAMQAFGYYSPSIRSNLERTPEGFRAVYSIEKGAPVVVTGRDIDVIGPGGDQPRIRAAVESFEPDVGERFVHSEYEQSKTAISSALQAQGYLDAKLLVHRVTVSIPEGSARIDLEWRSGARYRLGDVSFSGGQFREAFLQRFVPWREGESAFSSEQLLTLQERLFETGYFTSVIVEPLYAEATGREVPVQVRVAPDKRNAYVASLFYGTDSGLGIDARYERRWVNSHGHKLIADVGLAERKQHVTVSYRMPRGGPNDLSENFAIAWRDQDTATVRSRGTQLVANRTQRWHGLQRTLGFQLIRDEFEIAGDTRTTTFLYPGAALARSWADDWQFPRQGYSLSFLLRGSMEGILAETSFLQTRADATWIRAFDERNRLLLRGALGATAVDDFTRLPPDLRFFAGGDRSIRGFDYESLGALDASGEVIGGKHLATVSAEYEHYFTESWGAALFVDAGDAFATEAFDLHVGAGIGVRWKSPVGVVRVDLAKPVTPEKFDGFRLHVVIGPDL